MTQYVPKRTATNNSKDRRFCGDKTSSNGFRDRSICIKLISNSQRKEKQRLESYVGKLATEGKEENFHLPKQRVK
jgi:hypothetical protein